MKLSPFLILQCTLCFCCLLLGCSLQAPELVVTGERTALERQVLGSYQQLNEDLWLLSSYTPGGGQSALKRRAGQPLGGRAQAAVQSR